MSAVRTAAGFTGPLSSVRLPPNHYHAWIELHIEQGPLLEREGIPLGIVTSIAAPAGYRFTITGFGGHAGALLMPDRKDALCAAAELILSVEKHALATGAIDTVATVGTCEVHPGAVNSVPSRVVLQLDIRDTDPDRREAVMQAVRRDCEELRQRRKVTHHRRAGQRRRSGAILSAHRPAARRRSARSKASRTKKWSAAPTTTRSSWPASRPSP